MPVDDHLIQPEDIRLILSALGILAGVVVVIAWVLFFVPLYLM